MIFDWNLAKSAKNEAERGFGFDFAARIFLGRVLVAPSYPGSDGEARFLALGEIEGSFTPWSIPTATKSGGSSPPAGPAERSVDNGTHDP